MSDGPIRVFFVDDNRQLVAAWERFVSQQPDMQFIGAFSSAEGLAERARQQQPHVVIVDLSMDGPDPLGAVAELRKACPAVCTLVYSGHSREQWEAKVLSAGATAFVDKAQDPHTVLDMIRRLVKGQKA